MAMRGLSAAWPIAFVLPYVAVFLPSWSTRSATGYGSATTRPAIGALFADPIYLETVINTLLFLAIGVNVKLFLALLLSGFFMRKERWVQVAAAGVHPALGGAGDPDLHLDQLDAELRNGG